MDGLDRFLEAQKIYQPGDEFVLVAFRNSAKTLARRSAS
jgi:hypothetical protein